VTEPRLSDIVSRWLIVPIRTSSGESPEPDRVPTEGLRHGNDEQGTFLAAYTSIELFGEFGPPGSDHIELAARDLFGRADDAGERVIIDPGSPSQIQLPVNVLPFLAAGIDPNSPNAMRARQPLGALPALEAPGDIPEPFGTELRRALGEMPQVARAWLLRGGRAWTVGIQLRPEAELGDFDEVRNKLHAVATEHLGSRRELAVTDLRAAALRDAYDEIAAPFYVARDTSKGFLSRLFGG
jgi:hypothetical protein